MPQKYTSRAPGASVLHHRFGTARHGTTLHGMAQHGTARHSTAHGTRHTVHDTRHTAHGHHQPQQQQQPQARISFSTAMHSMCSHQDQPHLQHWLHREATKTCTTRLPRCRKLLAVIRLGGCCCYCQDVVSSFRSANVGTSAKVYFWLPWGMQAEPATAECARHLMCRNCFWKSQKRVSPLWFARFCFPKGFQNIPQHSFLQFPI